MVGDMSKLRIVQFCDNFFPQIDGVVKVVHNCALRLNQKEDCIVVVPKYEKHPYDDTKFSYPVCRKLTKVMTFNNFEVPFPKTDRELTKKIQDFDGEIYHCHSPFFMGHYALKLAKKKNIPVVATFHSQFKEDFLATTNNKVLTNWMIKYIVDFFDQCDEVWAPSRKAAEILKSYGYEKEVFVMENGTDFVYPEHIDEIKEKARQDFKIDKAHKNLLYVGQLRFVKNLKLVLHTMLRLIRKDNSYHLYLVGEGLNEEEMRTYVKKHHLENNIHFVGKIADIKVLSSIYAICDLFFFPSTYDTYSIAVREACIMETPSLLTIGSSAAEAFTNDVNGFLANGDVCSMEKRILEIFSDDAHRIEVGKVAAKTIPITFDTMVDRTLERYRYLIAKRKESEGKKKRTVRKAPQRRVKKQKQEKKKEA